MRLIRFGMSVGACVHKLIIGKAPVSSTFDAVTFICTCSNTEPTRSVIGRHVHADSSYGS